VLLTLPFPDSLLLPNRKEHWTVKSPVVKTARQVAWATSLEAIMRIPGWQPISQCEIYYTWFPPDNRRRDDDGYILACKPFLDGLVDSGLLLDDSNKVVQRVSGSFGPADKANPRTEVLILYGE
jgi:hypothetical protein